jgi:hypothetical protein
MELIRSSSSRDNKPFHQSLSVLVAMAVRAGSAPFLDLFLIFEPPLTLWVRQDAGTKRGRVTSRHKAELVSLSSCIDMACVKIFMAMEHTHHAWS